MWDGQASEIASVNYSSAGSASDYFLEITKGTVRQIDQVEIYASSLEKDASMFSFYRATVAAGMTATTSVVGSMFLSPKTTKIFSNFVTDDEKIGVKVLSPVTGKILFTVKYYYNQNI